MKISVVLVTFNRLDCLKKSLEKFEKQILPPIRLIVVNNKSTDGTEEFLDEWKNIKISFEKIVITTEKNLGGAGGFATGLRKAIEYSDAEWIWLSDDDAFVAENTLKNLDAVYNRHLSSKNVSAVFTSVVNDGSYDLNHRRKVEKGLFGVKFQPISAKEYEEEYFKLDQGSYVGMLVKTELVKKYGVTREDFFIYYDDTEHCERLRNYGDLYCIPSAKTFHGVAANTEFNWKSYYGLRNSTILIKEYYGNYAVMIHVLKRYLKEVSPFNRRNSKRVKNMLKAGLIDGLKGEQGLHELYKPGWKA